MHCWYWSWCYPVYGTDGPLGRQTVKYMLLYIRNNTLSKDAFAMKKIKKKMLLLALAVIIAFIFAGCGYSRTTKETAETTIGIDVAKYQGKIDWQQVAASGIDFAMIRVGYRTMVDGIINEDGSARYNLQEASEAGVCLGVYFFSTAVSEEEAVEEAKWVLDMISQYPITYPVVYDCEGYSAPDSRQYALTQEQRTDIALAFLETIEKHGYEGMFYSSRNELHNESQWDVSRIEKDYKIWVAQYPELPYPHTPESSYYDTHHMWQFTTEGQVPGISQSVDMNVAYFGYDGIEKPRDDTPAEEVEFKVEALIDFRPVDESVTAKESTNLRDVPSQGDDSHVLYTLKNGQIARRIAISDSGWSKVEFEGNVYFAVSSYLTTDMYYTPGHTTSESADEGIQTQFTPVNKHVTAKDKVNLRLLPSVEHNDAKVIAQLKKGDVAICVGESENGWSKLIYQGTTCYAVTSYLMESTAASNQPPADDGQIQTEFEHMDDLVTAKKEVNLRALPSVTDPEAVVVAKLYNGDVVTRTGINHDVGWSRVVYNGQTLYCVSSYLTSAE